MKIVWHKHFANEKTVYCVNSEKQKDISYTSNFSWYNIIVHFLINPSFPKIKKKFDHGIFMFTVCNNHKIFTMKI